MKTWMNKIAITSVVLLLLSVNAIAQSEKNVKNVVNNPHGLVLEKEEVVIKSGDTKEIKLSLLEGYRNPLLIHGNNINTLSENDCISIKICKDPKGRYSVKIKAKDVKEKKTETIYFKAQGKSKPKVRKPSAKYDSKVKNKFGIPLVVKINPK